MSRVRPFSTILSPPLSSSDYQAFSEPSSSFLSSFFCLILARFLAKSLHCTQGTGLMLRVSSRASHAFERVSWYTLTIRPSSGMVNVVTYVLPSAKVFTSPPALGFPSLVTTARMQSWRVGHRFVASPSSHGATKPPVNKPSSSVAGTARGLSGSPPCDSPPGCPPRSAPPMIPGRKPSPLPPRLSPTPGFWC